MYADAPEQHLRAIRNVIHNEYMCFDETTEPVLSAEASRWGWY